MEFPHVTFNYNIEKDIENIEIGLETVSRGRQPDKELAQIIQRYDNTPSKEALKSYLESRWAKKEQVLSLIIKQLQGYWDEIEKDYFTHLANRMQLTSFYDIKNLPGFLSTRYGSGYKVEPPWFAVSVHNGTLQNSRTAMHEIMHIFFHKQWWDFCLGQGVSSKNVWDIKEATTVLLNFWFKDKLVDIDWGYEEHAELRRLIKEWFLKTPDFKNTLQKSCEYIKLYPEKSPNWISN